MVSHKTIIMTQGELEETVARKIFFESLGFNVIIISKNGLDCLNNILKHKPDAIILDLFLSNFDALEVLMRLKVEKLNPKPVIAVLSNSNNNKIERELLANGADYVAIRPFDDKILCSRIYQFIEWKTENNSESFETNLNDTNLKNQVSINWESIISKMLHRIGVPAHLQGYHYLRHGILISIKNYQGTSSITKTIYPEVAETFETTTSRVERSIRHAIEVTWKNGNKMLLESFFGKRNNNKKPTNGEFIAVLSEIIRLEKI